MSTTNDFRPNWTSAPGRTIEEILKTRELSIEVFAQKMNQSVENIRHLITGYVEITRDLALQLEEILGSSSSFWLKRDIQYRETLARLKEEEEAQWVRELPFKDMVKFGWLKDTKDRLKVILNYFDVPDLATWKIKYSEVHDYVSFRTSSTFQSTQGAVAVWLRQGEIKAKSIECKKWNEERFLDSLTSIKVLTREKDPKEFIPKLVKICSESGVAVVIIPTPEGCRASGATRFVSADKAIIQLSFRYLSDDHFWFTFFHEAGHLILHGKHSLFFEETRLQRVSKEEEEANSFAGAVLIPYTLEKELGNIKSNKRRIIQFAMSAGVSPGIVVGQLQHRGYIDKSYLNGYKRRYDWKEIIELSNL